MGRNGKGAWGCIDPMGPENAAVACGQLPILKLRQLANTKCLQWRLNHDGPDWDYKVEEKEGV